MGEGILEKQPGSVHQYPQGFSLPVEAGFKKVRSTINSGFLEQAIFELDVSQDNPFICIMSVSRDGHVWWEDNKIQCKVWGKMSLHVLAWTQSISIFDTSRRKRTEYNASIRKAEFFEEIE
jgi:hypothetical protein